MMKTVIALALLLTVSCSQTTVTRLSNFDRDEAPNGKVYVGWSEYKLLFPLIIRTDAILPQVGEQIRAEQAFGEISIYNPRVGGTEYPGSASQPAGPARREIRGSVKLLSKDSVLIDAYFINSDGHKVMYPFSGKHRIKPAPQ